MSSRIAQAFARARAENRAALVIYLCAGDRELSWTPKLIAAAAEGGADVIEVGVPFSDPTADGATIQRAGARALEAGTTVKGVLDAIRTARETTDVPIVLFSYYNPILRFGEERLAQEAKHAGVDGLLVVDLPPELAQPLLEPAAREGLDFVPLVAPTSTPERIDRAARLAGSFLYYVSATGVTGMAGADLAEAGRRAAAVRERAGKPVAVGFGVRTPEDAAILAEHAEGIVVGSAIVERVEAAADLEDAVRTVREEVGRLAAAARR